MILCVPWCIFEKTKGCILEKTIGCIFELNNISTVGLYTYCTLQYLLVMIKYRPRINAALESRYINRHVRSFLGMRVHFLKSLSGP